ncbi:MAG TPA: TauD/TfdA family dioxygenase [Burkholderiales bacterium]|jgi:taurine dioxygenase|nr:TauD/TfdA family dioxygenase [Burkholderiales bacterium]
MPGITVTPVGYALGAEVTGIDLAQPMSKADAQAVLEAWHKHLILVFPDQHITPQQQIDFSRHFGALDQHESQPFNRHPEYDEVMLITNKLVRGKPSQTKTAGQNWHTDLSYTIRPAKGTTLYCVEKPTVGGDTLFANMYLAYETLSDKMRQFLDGLEGVHDASLVASLDKRDPALTAEFKRLNPLVIHPAVRTHPGTNRRALYVNQRVRNFLGMSEGESRAIIDYLCDYAVQPRFVYRHRWRLNDMIMWDNRCLTHLAVGDYDPAESRHMTRTSLLGEYVGRLLNPADAPAAQTPAQARDLAAAISDAHD